MSKRIAVLGSTGSIGVNTLRVVSAFKKEIKVAALSADSNIELLSRQAKLFRPETVCVGSPSLAVKMRSRVPAGTKVLCGAEGLDWIASQGNIEKIVFAISGSACLKPLITAIRNKKRIALANKEALVSAGHLIMELARSNNVPIIPIDSEHSAIFQCLEGKRPFLNKIYLTATGGPLLNVPLKKFDKLSPRAILNHPKWRMGKKISVDSATMMNKGLEIIEAKWLFDVDEDMIEVLVHPEAIIHSMVELTDGAIFAEMSMPDMRIPIQYALTYPCRLDNGIGKVDFAKLKNLSFEKPDTAKFPCLVMAREALKKGGTYPAVLNVADEGAVAAYLEGKIKFTRIPYVIEKALKRHRGRAGNAPSLDEVYNAQMWAKEEVANILQEMKN